MTIDEIIAGLKELIEDRDSFITGKDEESDEMFIRDKAVLEAALAVITKGDAQ